MGILSWRRTRREFSLPRAGGDKPGINDELGYQGAGDGFSEGDIIEGHLGVFLGGGYGTTGEKYGRKLGQYCWGDFDADDGGGSGRCGATGAEALPAVLLAGAGRIGSASRRSPPGDFLDRHFGRARALIR